ncbi:hypothetical protein [Desulfovibrio sp. ZJ200]|uniref:hypothetical protein n=1 Tax=Desulfovibrio sp. ZJ200 TaxID=2709792 RepID=UPI0013EC0DDA|nr:hypothetical protein [Desulfovibrio sp. ZJ200]
MARLTAEQWEQARADYEVRGISLGDVARTYGVATSSVSRRARAEGWTQGRLQDLAARKVAAVKEMAEVETQTQDLPVRFQHTLQSVVQERLQAERLLASLDVALAAKAITLAHQATSAADIETLSRARRNLAPAQQAPAQQTTVTVNQQAQAGAALMTPRDVLEDIRKGAALRAWDEHANPADS